jgi:condensin-2 complex subunit D3
MLGFTAEEDEEDEDTKMPSAALSRCILSANPKKPAFRLAIPNKLITLVQLLLNSNLPTQSGACDQTIECPDIVRANAFVTLGKICLRDRARARDHINIFLREITPGKSKSRTIRSNCLLILGDLCVRYTSLVEHHIGTMAGCLQDTDVTIRRHTMILLTQLLVQDYLKWRGLLLFRYLASVADPDPETAELCKALIKGTVLGKFVQFDVVRFIPVEP